MKVLVTGGIGYIGSHTVVELDKAGYEVVIVDNLSNSREDVLDELKKITGKSYKFYKGDCRDTELMDKIFTENKIDSVIHFAGLKAVGESCSMPLEYYDNNIGSTLVLLETMRKHGCFNFVFSSSATVYGDPEKVPITEDQKLGATNPYGMTKLTIEYILKDLYNSDNKWNIAILRYFNPLGAHESGLIGERPNGIPNNLVPYVTQVAAGIRDHLRVWGNDYDTIDGTGVRDYIHVCDLALGHIKALKKLETNSGLVIYNLGTGNGYSVLQVVNAFIKATGMNVPYKIYDRRPGDIATCYCDPSKAYNEIGFKATRNIDDMLTSSWKFQKHLEEK